MTSSSNDESRKSEFMNRVVDITSKINVAVNNLITLTGSDIRYFSEDEAQNIRNAINDITRGASLILTDSVSIIAPDELEKIKQSCSFSTASQRNDEPYEKYDDDILNNLPDAAAADIVRLIGINQAMKLFKAFGGSTFPIGKGMRYLGGPRAKALQAILKDEEIKRLMDYFQGDIIYLPRCDRLLREIRNRKFIREFAEMRQQGTSALMAMTHLCPKHGFSDRYGWQLLKKERNSQLNQQASK
ncbi:TPA: Mor transcription activator family protein [Raoultella ornithinolytica]|uniref:Mor transcription activator family protein n=1 Tax=Klebsiella michiganensis TaxID=1134687 RepID=UPI0015E4CCFF|nr:Mor transcription activator family protein [Klebsiella michiganensis]QLP50934.1 hypothetical protein HV105_29840 [Klebsiella michiganensis]